MKEFKFKTEHFLDLVHDATKDGYDVARGVGDLWEPRVSTEDFVIRANKIFQEFLKEKPPARIKSAPVTRERFRQMRMKNKRLWEENQRLRKDLELIQELVNASLEVE